MEAIFTKVLLEKLVVNQKFFSHNKLKFSPNFCFKWAAKIVQISGDNSFVYHICYHINIFHMITVCSILQVQVFVSKPQHGFNWLRYLTKKCSI